MTPAGVVSNAMIERLEWLGLAAPSPPRLAAFYRDDLGLPAVEPDSAPIDPPPPYAFDLADGFLAVRSLQTMPSGGVHTHFAIEISPAHYDVLYDRLDADHELVERDFGGNRSLYCIDPAGHCVEFGERPAVDDRLGAIFEVVVEIHDLDAAERRYTALGFAPVDRGRDRRRVRLRGPFDLELWEPHLGIANARGGCHVELGLRSDDPRTDARRLRESAAPAARPANRVTVTDPDGHTLSIADSTG